MSFIMVDKLSIPLRVKPLDVECNSLLNELIKGG